MDYISHHALHTHIPVHHYTNHTAVTIHSLVLIASPHLHLILTLTFKQHSHLHSLRSLVLPWLTFPSIFPCVYYLDRWLSLLIVCCLPYWPRLPTGYPLSAACPDPLLCLCLCICLIYVALDTTIWYLPVWPPLCINKAASGSTLASDQSLVTVYSLKLKILILIRWVWDDYLTVISHFLFVWRLNTNKRWPLRRVFIYFIFFVIT